MVISHNIDLNPVGTISIQLNDTMIERDPKNSLLLFNQHVRGGFYEPGSVSFTRLVNDVSKPFTVGSILEMYKLHMKKILEDERFLDGTYPRYPIGAVDRGQVKALMNVVEELCKPHLVDNAVP